MLSTVNPSKEMFCLSGKDVVSAQVSDHHPVVHNGVLFWNMMMQGKARRSRQDNRIVGYNNGFGFIESDKQYLTRITQVAYVIAELCYRDPTIEVITLCEGPIKPEHLNQLLATLKPFPWMKRFLNEGAFYKPSVSGAPAWGLLMLADQKYQVAALQCDSMKQSPTLFAKLANRFQLWELRHASGKKYVGLGHFPFAGDEHVIEQSRLSNYGNAYRQLVKQVVKQFADEEFTLCADFNFNPYLVSRFKDRVVDRVPSHNSILYMMPAKGERHHTATVTVDGILLSKSAKQRYTYARGYPGFFQRSRLEMRLVQSATKQQRQVKNDQLAIVKRA